jgi:hypothetical protein
VATLHRAFEPTVGEQIPLIVDGRPLRGTAIDVRKDFSTRAGVRAFTVMADETNSDPSLTGSRSGAIRRNLVTL